MQAISAPCSDFSQLVPTYTVHTATTQCDSYMVEALTVFIATLHVLACAAAAHFFVIPEVR